MVARLRRLLPGVWAGMLLCIALVATPSVFALLPTADAGRVVARIFAIEASTSLVLALLLLLIERGLARSRSAAGHGSVFSAEILLLLGTVFCTVAGYYAIAPLLGAARAGQGMLTFAQLHLLSTTLFGLKTLLVLMLGWRGAAAFAAPGG